MRFIAMVGLAFCAGGKPVPTRAKPACMNITRNPATSVQTKLIDVVVSATDFATSSIFGGAVSAKARAGMRRRNAASASVRIDFAVMALQSRAYVANLRRARLHRRSPRKWFNGGGKTSRRGCHPEAGHP